MRFTSFRVDLKRACTAMLCAVLCITALGMAIHSWSSLRKSEESRSNDIHDGSTAVSSTSAQVDSLGDVGGEFVSESDSYTGELSIPAHISLDRIDVSLDLCKPLDSARVSSLFGYRQNPVTGKYSFHSGYDLAAAHGSNIYAMYSGEVVTAAYDSGYGYYLVLQHEGGFQTLYAHCSQLLCDVGDRVNAGSIIALVGSTGNSTGAHLHVEFRKGGKRYDPEWILGGIY